MGVRIPAVEQKDNLAMDTKQNSVIRILICTATLFAVFFSLLLLLYLRNMSPLARPQGVPEQAYNLGNLVQPSYWHWCDDGDLIKYCEAFGRSGGFPIYSGVYMPIPPLVISNLRQNMLENPGALDAVLDELQASVIFSDAYNWPVAERIAPVGVRTEWSYRYFLQDCLLPLRNLHALEFEENWSTWSVADTRELVARLNESFDPVGVEFELMSNGQVNVIDQIADVSGILTRTPVGCYDRVYLSEALLD